MGLSGFGQFFKGLYEWILLMIVFVELPLSIIVEEQLFSFLYVSKRIERNFVASIAQDILRS